MATTPINMVEAQGPKKSRLETFANVMGILTSLGSLAGNAYDTFGPKSPKGMDIFGGLPKAPENPGLNLFKDPSLTGGMDKLQSTYNNPFFNGYESSPNKVLGGF